MVGFLVFWGDYLKKIILTSLFISSFAYGQVKSLNEMTETVKSVLKRAERNNTFRELLTYSMPIEGRWVKYAEYGTYNDNPNMVKELNEQIIDGIRTQFETYSSLETGESFSDETDLLAPGADTENEKQIAKTFDINSVTEAYSSLEEETERFLNSNPNFVSLYSSQVKYRRKDVCKKTQSFETLKEFYMLSEDIVFKKASEVATSSESWEARVVRTEGKIVGTEDVISPFLPNEAVDVTSTKILEQKDKTQGYYLAEDTRCVEFDVMIRAERLVTPDLKKLDPVDIARILTSYTFTYEKNLSDRIEEMIKLIANVKAVQFIMPRRADVSMMPKALKDRVMNNERFEIKLFEEQIPLKPAGDYGIFNVIPEDIYFKYFVDLDRERSKRKIEGSAGPSEDYILKHQAGAVIDFLGLYIRRNLEVIISELYHFQQYYSEIRLDPQVIKRSPHATLIHEKINDLAGLLYPHVIDLGKETAIEFYLHKTNYTILGVESLRTFFEGLTDIANIGIEDQKEREVYPYSPGKIVSARNSGFFDDGNDNLREATRDWYDNYKLHLECFEERNEACGKIGGKVYDLL